MCVFFLYNIQNNNSRCEQHFLIFNSTFFFFFLNTQNRSQRRRRLRCAELNLSARQSCHSIVLPLRFGKLWNLWLDCWCAVVVALDWHLFPSSSAFCFLFVCWFVFLISFLLRVFEMKKTLWKTFVFFGFVVFLVEEEDHGLTQERIHCGCFETKRKTNFYISFCFFVLRKKNFFDHVRSWLMWFRWMSPLVPSISCIIRPQLNRSKKMLRYIVHIIAVSYRLV